MPLLIRRDAVDAAAVTRYALMRYGLSPCRQRRRADAAILIAAIYAAYC